MANYTPLPTPPVPGSPDFEAQTGQFLDAMPLFGSEMKAIADEVADKAALVDVEGLATMAATAASQANISAKKAADSAASVISVASTAAVEAEIQASKAVRKAAEAELAASQAGLNAQAAANSVDESKAWADAAAASAALADSAGNATAAQQARIGAETAEAHAETAQAAAESARDLAKAWATQIGSQVVAGQGYSAQHHATAAAARATAAAASETAAAASATQAAGYAGLMLAASTSDSVIRLNPRAVTADLLIPAGFNAGSTGPLVIADRVTVTVSNHSTWSIQ